MIRSLRSLLPAALALALLHPAAPAAAQSLFASRGLGLVMQPIEARGAALGGLGLGFPEGTLSLVNPAAMAGLPAPALLAGFQFDGHSATLAGEEESGTTARFPLLHGAYPINERWVVGIGFGSLLDQSWAVEVADTQYVGTDTLPVTDRFTSDGGVARLRLGAAYRLTERLAIGLALDAHTGSLNRAVQRDFGGAFVPASTGVRWRYSGLGYGAGVHWTPSGALALDAAATFGGTLDAEATDSLSESGSFDLPLSLAVGASGRVTPNTLVALGASWDGWSSADEALRQAGGAEVARDSWAVQGGVEWEAISLGDRVVPLRLGGRYQTLPFRAATGGDWATEQALTAGLGIRLAGGGASLDVSLERGSRDGGAALEESYWRSLVTLRVLGR